MILHNMLFLFAVSTHEMCDIVCRIRISSYLVSRCFFFQAEDGIRDLVRSRGLGDVYKRQPLHGVTACLQNGGRVAAVLLATDVAPERL